MGGGGVNCFVGFVQAVYLRTVIAAAISVARASEDFHRGRLESERAKREAERWRREASMTQPIESKNSHEQERDEAFNEFKDGNKYNIDSIRECFDAGADWGAAYERKRAEKLVRALDRAIEVMEFAYMNAPKQPPEIKEAREALAAYEEVGEEFDPTPWCAACGAMKPSKCNCGPIAENE